MSFKWTLGDPPKLVGAGRENEQNKINLLWGVLRRWFNKQRALGSGLSYDSEDQVQVGTGGVLPIANGGTAASTAAGARTNLGLGTMAVVNSPAPIGNGGTGAATAAAALIALIGTPTKGSIIVGDGTNWQLLAVGNDGDVLTADSVEDRGVKWAPP